MYYLCRENKGADQLHCRLSYYAADLHLCILQMRKAGSHDAGQFVGSKQQGDRQTSYLLSRCTGLSASLSITQA